MGAGADLFAKLAEDAIDLAVIESEGELEGIADAKLDTVGIAEDVAGDAFAVDPGTMAAVEVLNDVGSVFGDDARVLAGGSVIAQDEVVVGLASQEEGKRL